MKQKFNILGMSCSSCVSHVEKAVGKLDGVDKVEVNLLSNSMQVEYKQEKLKSQDIIQTVIQAGYGANLVQEEKQKKKDNIDIAKQEIKEMKIRLIVSFICLIPLMYISMHHMLGDWLGFLVPDIVTSLFHGPKNAINFAFSQFLLLLPILYVNRKYFIVGFKMLAKKTPNMDSLIAIGSVAATLYGIFAIFQIGIGLANQNFTLVSHYTMDIYFESAGTILTLITLGKYLETKSKGRTSDAINKLIDLAPKTAIVLRNNIEMTIGVEEVKVEDIVILKPGMSVPVDGVIIEGSSTLDEASITGESIPVEKQVGDRVIAATINKSGYLKFRAEKVGKDTTLSQIIQLVEEANSPKAPIAKLADKISGVFVPIVITIAILATVIWLVLGYPVEFALSIGISVLVISCPCALGLATPVSIMVGTGKGAQNGILIKSAEGLEIAHLVKTIVLDKTGTITQGKPSVTDIYTNQDENKMLQIVASLEKGSEHPLAKAILEKNEQEKSEYLPITEFENFEGMGVKAKVLDDKYLAGNQTLMKQHHIQIDEFKEIADNVSKQGKTPIYFSNETTCLGIIAIADKIKDTSKQAVSELQKMGLEVVMLTGDNKNTAQQIQTQVGINSVFAEVLPQEKEKQVHSIQKQGKKVMMVGDGINDAPALARADVGVAIGAGTDIAIEAADIILMKSDLLDLVSMIQLSKAVIRNIKMNLFWAFFYNSIGIPLAAGVFFLSLGWKLNPMFAAAAMSISSVCVVLNALRLTRFHATYVKVKEEKINMEKKIKIEGMQCNHCKMSVEKALNVIEGVENATVNLEEKTATIVINKEVSEDKIKQVIEEVGFHVIGIE